MPTPPPEKLMTPDGPMTRKEAAAFYGIPRGTLTRRIWEGKPKSEWFKKPRKPKLRKRSMNKPRANSGYITAYGHKTVAQLSLKLGLTEASLRHRMYNLGWTEEEVFNTPYKGRPGIDFVLPPDEYRRRYHAQLVAYSEFLHVCARDKRRTKFKALQNGSTDTPRQRNIQRVRSEKRGRV